MKIQETRVMKGQLRLSGARGFALERFTVGASRINNVIDRCTSD